MRLLSKTDIQQQKSAARKLEIDEGKKLALSVDRLREVRIEEEKSLEEYRSQTIASIQEQITVETAKRDQLKGEVRTLEQRKEEAVKGLDEEWDKVASEKAALFVSKSQIKEREEDISKREVEISSIETKTNNLLEKAKMKEETANNVLIETNLAKEEASEDLRKAREILEESKSYQEVNTKILLKREEEIAIREHSASLRESNIRDKEELLDREWKLLEDRKAQFERNIKSLSKQNG